MQVTKRHAGRIYTVTLIVDLMQAVDQDRPDTGMREGLDSYLETPP